MTMNEMHAPEGMRVMYFVWGWLLFLSLVEVTLAYLNVPLLIMLFALLALSILKAAMIMSWFMHLKFERMNLIFTIVPAMVLCLLLMNVIWPDSVRVRSRAMFHDLPVPTPGE